MPDTPKDDSDKLPEREAEALFNDLVGRLVNTKPHKDEPKKRER